MIEIFKKIFLYHGTRKINQFILVLKVTTLLLFVSFLHLSAATLSQTINLKAKNKPLSEVLSVIKEQTGLGVIYNNRLINTAKDISITANNMPLDRFLREVLSNTGLTYLINENSIFITKYEKEDSRAIGQNAIIKSQQSVTGTVTDEKGTPIVGVSVSVKNGQARTITDGKGFYKINVPNLQSVLVFRYVGFVVQEKVINENNVLNIKLIQETSKLDEVVVVGYGTQLKKDLTGSISSLGNEEINKGGATSFLDAMQGKMAGVQITSSSGEPGGGTNIIIRGANSVYGSSAPLFIIDGIPIDQNNSEVVGASIGNGQTYDPMASINPSDVESIEVLKDASATAIYGSRGANGVVIVTTKSGKAGVSRLEYDGYVSVGTQSKRLEVLNPTEYIAYRSEIDSNSPLFYNDSNKDGAFNELDEPRDIYSLPVHDWQKEILRTTTSSNHGISLSGGSGKTNYAGSLGLLNEEGLVRNNDYSRYTMNLKLNHAHNEKLKFGFNTNMSHALLNGATQSGGGASIFNGVVQNILISRPIEVYVPAWDVEGKYVSPISMIKDAYKNTTTTRNNLGSYLEYQPIAGLTFNISVGGILSNSKGKEFYGSNTSWGTLDNGRATIAQQKMFTWFNTNRVTYNKRIKQHQFTAMAAFELNQYDIESFLLTTTNFPDESTGVEDISKGRNVHLSQSNHTQNNRLSYFGRLNYSYKNRYLFTSTMRADGSDKFGPGNRFGYFPSASIAWRVSEEQFLKKIKVVNDLKIRTSYGRTGNERIPSYQYMARMSNTYYNGDLGLAPSSLANPDLKWESTDQYNAGFDLSILNQRVELTTDVYLKQTRNLLLPAYIDSQTGYVKQWRNIGQVDNTGLEIQLSTVNLDQKNFKWSTNFSVSFNKNEVKKLGGGSNFIPVTIGGGWLTNVGRVIEGQPLGTAFGYEFDGIYQIDDFTWQNNSDPGIPHLNRTYVLKPDVVGVNGVVLLPGSFRFKDKDQNGIVNEDDRGVISYSHPKHTGGITNNFKYKGLELNVFLMWSYGNQIFNESKFRLEGGIPNTWMNMNRDFWYNRWTPENPTNSYGNFSAETRNKTSLLTSSYYVEDASYLRLKSVTLSYTLPKHIVSNLKLSNIRLYAVGNNLFTWTKYSSFDPEINSGNAMLPGFDRISYPRSKSILFGLNVSF